jgi:hypothetical protein
MDQHKQFLLNLTIFENKTQEKNLCASYLFGKWTWAWKENSSMYFQESHQ